MGDAIRRLADHAGILPGYRDAAGVWRETGDDTRAALLAAMGLPSTERGASEWFGSPAEAAMPSWRVVEAEVEPSLVPPEEWRLTLEDGTEQEGSGPLPALPVGRHRMVGGGETCWLLSAPARLPLPQRGWGLMAPLSGLYGSEAGGPGTYADLATLGEDIAAHGAGFLGIGSLHAGFPADPDSASPLLPSHRSRLSTLHVATSPGAAPANGPEYRAGEIPARIAALREAFDTFEAAGGDPAFDAWVAAEGEALELFALHQALSDRHGPYWENWPRNLHDPKGDGAREASAALGDRIRFHAWSQWMAETQFSEAQECAKAAGMAHGLYLDLAAGAHPHGAETWAHRDRFATGICLGAPAEAPSSPDRNLSLTPFNPRALIETGFEPLADMFARQLRFCGLLRIDHIFGFERAFWVPQGVPGAHVQMPRDAMLAVARIAAARTGATIVGDDVGGIPKSLGRALDESGLLGCRLTMLERDPGDPSRGLAPEDYPERAIASFSARGRPTWRGWRAGSDIDARERQGDLSAEAAGDARATRSSEVDAFDRGAEPFPDHPPEDAARMHAHLGGTRARLAAVQVEDVLDVEAHPDLPGRDGAHPERRSRTPEALTQDPRLVETARIMTENGR